MSDQTDHRDEADRIMREAYSTSSAVHLLAAIHDEQQTQTGLLLDLRGAIDDLAEALRPKPLGTHDRIGSRCTRVGCLELHDPEPDTLAEALDALPEGTVAYDGNGYRWWREEGSWRAFPLHQHTPASSRFLATFAPIGIESIPGEDVLPTDPPAPPAAHESDDQPQGEAEGAKAAAGRTGANLALVERVARAIFEEHNKSGLDFDGYPRAISLYAARAVLDSLTPADFGWTVMGEGQVAVDRDDLRALVRTKGDSVWADGFAPANRLRDVLDGEQP